MLLGFLLACAFAAICGLVLAAAFARAVLYKNVLVELACARPRRRMSLFPRPRVAPESDGSAEVGFRSRGRG